MNKVIESGRIVKDIELKRTASGKAVVQFALAVDRGISKNKQVEGQPTADFFDCVAWNTNAEFAAKYLSKGSKVLVEGHLSARTYKDQQGQNRKVVEIVVDRFEFLESKRQQSAAPAQGNNFGGGFGQQANDIPEDFF